jgi:hypothetical protein
VYWDLGDHQNVALQNIHQTLQANDFIIHTWLAI